MPTPHVLLGFDIGGTSARAALFDLEGTKKPSALPRGTLERVIRKDRSPGAILETIDELGLELLTQHGLDTSNLLATGVGLAAQLDTSTSHVINAPNLGWRDLALGELLAERDGPLYAAAPVHFFNDLNALVCGDVWDKNSTNSDAYDDVLAASIGSGVGGAMLIAGGLVLGARGQAGELGHVKVESPTTGKLCGCGERGCLEAYAGGVHLEATIERFIYAHSPDWAQEVEREPGSAVRIDLAIADALSEEVEELDAIFALAARHLVQVLGAATTMLNPGVLLLGGGVWRHCAIFRRRVLTQLPLHILMVAREQLRIEEIGEAGHLATLGAALLAMQRVDA